MFKAWPGLGGASDMPRARSSLGLLFVILDRPVSSEVDLSRADRGGEDPDRFEPTLPKLS